MARSARRFTIYDVMEEKGLFESNPANVNSRDGNGMAIYKKADYPRMLYHPEGEHKITRPAEPIATPFGPKMVGEQTELINVIVQNEAEEAEFLKKGWHRLPILALRAGAKKRGETLPEIPTDTVDAVRIEAELKDKAQREELEALRAKIAELEAEAAIKPKIAK